MGCLHRPDLPRKPPPRPLSKEETWKHRIVTPQVRTAKCLLGASGGRRARSVLRDSRARDGGGGRHRGSAWIRADGDLCRRGDIPVSGADGAQGPLLAGRDRPRARDRGATRPAAGGSRTLDEAGPKAGVVMFINLLILLTALAMGTLAGILLTVRRYEHRQAETQAD